MRGNWRLRHRATAGRRLDVRQIKCQHLGASTSIRDTTQPSDARNPGTEPLKDGGIRLWRKAEMSVERVSETTDD